MCVKVSDKPPCQSLGDCERGGQVQHLSLSKAAGWKSETVSELWVNSAYYNPSVMWSFSQERIWQKHLFCGKAYRSCRVGLSLSDRLLVKAAARGQ